MCCKLMWSFSLSDTQLRFQYLRDVFHFKANYKAFLYRHATASTCGVNLGRKNSTNKRICSKNTLFRTWGETTEGVSICGEGSTNIWATGTQCLRYIHSIFCYASTHYSCLVLRRYPVISPCNTTRCFKCTKLCSLSLGKQ